MVLCNLPQTEYYPNDGGTVYMKVFAPQATIINVGQVAYTISGKKTLLWLHPEISQGSRTDNTNKELTLTTY